MDAPKTITVVSGLPRSGTSLMMKMLEAGGLSLLVDGVRAADEDNPKGYYEYEPVKQLKDDQEKRWLPEAQGKVLKVVAPLLAYLPRDYEYRVVFMRRAMAEILASQKQMLVRRGKDPDAVPDEVMAKAFEKQLAEVLAWMDTSANIQAIEVAYTELVQAPNPIIDALTDFLGAPLDKAAMAAVIAPELYRQREPANG